MAEPAAATAPRDDGEAKTKATDVIAAALQRTLASSHISRRPRQEDRFTLVSPLDCSLGDGSATAFFGVFDGTVGDYASDTVQSMVLPAIMASSKWKTYVESTKPAVSSSSDSGSGPDLQALRGAVSEGYRVADAELLKLCAKEKNDYASTTAVTALVASNVITFAHVGDSLAAIGTLTPSGIKGEFVMSYQNHKPDAPGERKRIEAAGGSVEYLHNVHNKPFIRGGDFLRRKAAGGKPMQLQYSRAFGGKDLKPFGLSCEPDVYQVPLDSVFCFILASDGLWDFCNAQTAVQVAVNAYQRGQEPSTALMQWALHLQEEVGGHADNVTAIVTFLSAPPVAAK